MTSPWVDGEAITAAKMYSRVEARLAALETATFDTAQLSSGFSITGSTGWASVYSYRVKAGVLYITVTMTRTGSTALTASSTGTLADTTVATLNTYKPATTQFGYFVATNSFGGAILNTDGTMVITDMHPSSSISQNDVAKFSWVFPVA